MIGYLLSRKKIRELEARLKAKEAEAEMLHKQLEDLHAPGEYKSEFCKACRFNYGLVGNRIICKACDDIPCEHFKPLDNK